MPGAAQIIQELFDGATPGVEITVEQTKANFFRATFALGNAQFFVNCKRPSPLIEYLDAEIDWDALKQAWEVVFGQTGEDTFALKQNGLQHQVLPTVFSIIGDFAERYTPEMIVFSAKEASRRGLYRHVVRREFPKIGYEQIACVKGDTTEIYALERVV